MKLYYSPGLCSLSPHIAIREADLQVQLVTVDVGTRTLHGGADYHAINPNGYVPVLQLDDGQLLTEGPAIVQYLADLKPSAHLAPPAGTMARYRLQEWLGYINSELHKTMSPLWDASVPEAMKQAVRDKIARRLQVASERLEGKAWALGEQFSVVDGYLFVVLGWLRGVGIELDRWPELKAYHRRVGERPAVREAMRAEGLLR